jgi:hypothetical protein
MEIDRSRVHMIQHSPYFWKAVEQAPLQKSDTTGRRFRAAGCGGRAGTVRAAA